MKIKETIFRLVLEIFVVDDPKFPHTMRFGYCWLRFNGNVLHRFSWTSSSATPVDAMRHAVKEWDAEWKENEVQKIEEWPK